MKEKTMDCINVEVNHFGIVMMLVVFRNNTYKVIENNGYIHITGNGGLFEAIDLLVSKGYKFKHLFYDVFQEQG